MGVEINISGVKVKGNANIGNNSRFTDSDVSLNVRHSSFKGKANVLNNAEVNKSDINANIKNSSFDEAEILNNVKANESKIATNIESSSFEEAKILNNVGATNSEVTTNVQNTYFESANIMNNTPLKNKFVNETYGKYPSEGTTKDVEETTQSFTSGKKKEGIIKKILKKLFGLGLKGDSSNVHEEKDGETRKTAHEHFEEELSGHGKYREYSSPDVVNEILKKLQQEKTNQNEQDIDKG